MDKNNLEPFLKWGLESDKNKKKAIKTACSIISILSQYDKKDLSEKELKKIIGGIETGGAECTCGRSDCPTCGSSQR